MPLTADVGRKNIIMNSTDYIARFKADPKNQISVTDPYFTIFIFFCVTLFGITLLEDVASFEFPIAIKYMTALAGAIAGLTGRKIAWARIRNMEAANKGLEGTGDPKTARQPPQP
jgi:hypothetical protein